MTENYDIIVKGINARVMATLFHRLEVSFRNNPVVIEHLTFGGELLLTGLGVMAHSLLIDADVCQRRLDRFRNDDDTPCYEADYIKFEGDCTLTGIQMDAYYEEQYKRWRGPGGREEARAFIENGYEW